MNWPDGVSDVDIELWCYAHDSRGEGEGGRLTRFQHFRNAVDLLWNCEDSTRHVVWNAWTDRMIQAMIEHRYVGFAGAGSSGKSDAAALFCLVEYLSAPSQTLCLLLSTTINGAKKRIWKSVGELWNSLESRWEREGKMMPGKLVESRNMICGMDANGKWSEALGLHLVAADKDNEKEAAKKLKGLKAPAEGKGRLRVVADEFSDLGESVLVAMVGNLNTNPDFKGIGMANPGSRLTPFAKFVKPKNGGWRAIKLGDEQWETEYGVCLSFNAKNSPRMLEEDGDRKYPWMASEQAIDQMARAFGEDSIEYWAQVLGMFCPEGMERTIWSEMELLNAMEPVTNWDRRYPVVKAMASDPAFVVDRDRSIMVTCEAGRINGKKVAANFKFEVAGIGAAVDDDDKRSMSEMLIDLMMTRAREEGIKPQHVGYDDTGGGKVFGQWLSSKWSRNCIPVDFGSSPIDRRADADNDHLIYGDRMAQLWVQAKGLVREGQIKGIPQEAIDEICERRYCAQRSGQGKIWVEKKKEMRKRTGKSPDVADAFFILIEVLIQNGLLDFQEIRKHDQKDMAEFRRLKEGMNVWGIQGGIGAGNFGGRNILLARPQPKRLSARR